MRIIIAFKSSQFKLFDIDLYLENKTNKDIKIRARQKSKHNIITTLHREFYIVRYENTIEGFELYETFGLAHIKILIIPSELLSELQFSHRNILAKSNVMRF